mmetsp:Transcript_22901/g.26578  ORF Transcript_22901/g.26578 Transcript_22901/m.26578 type:complete len:197 (+) Transcript_22901:48-638(+)
MPPKGKGDKKKVDPAKRNRISKWYPADDEKRHFTRKYRTPKTAALRKNIAPGQILILLGGRFKGKRVVFLKQLKSGLLLVTGPHKINGVPLKRVNQAYVIPTATKVDLAGVDASKIDDDYFARAKVQKAKKSEEAFFATAQEKPEEEKKRIQEKKGKQAEFDKKLIENIKKVDQLKSYLSARFTLTNRMRPHELHF